MNNDFNLWEKIICKKAVIGTEFLAQTIIFYIHILQPDVGDLNPIPAVGGGQFDPPL